MPRPSTETLYWYGTPASAEQFLRDTAAMEEKHVEISAFAATMDEEEDDGIYGAYKQFVNVVNGVGIISARGSMRAQESWGSLFFGIMTYETMANILAIMAEDPEVNSALIDADSPGGQAKGVEIASDAISAFSNIKPIETHSSGDILSAMYWVASSTDKITTTRHAEVGSIGVIAVHMEYSKMLEEEGIKATVFRKGDKKALITPYEPLTDAARAEMDKSMERSYSAFIEQVADGRGMSSEEVRRDLATGEVYTPREALANGMIDGIENYNHVVHRLSESGAESQPNGSLAAMKKPMLKAEDAAAAVAAGVPEQDLTPPAVIQQAEEQAAEPAAEEQEEQAVVTAEAEATSEPEPESGAEQQADSSGAQEDSWAKMYKEISDQLVEAKTSLAAVQQELSGAQEGVQLLSGVVIGMINHMRVPLGLQSEEQLSDLDAKGLVAMYEQVRGLYVNQFRVGATSQASDDEDGEQEQATDYLREAAVRLTSFD